MHINQFKIFHYLACLLWLLALTACHSTKYNAPSHNLPSEDADANEDGAQWIALDAEGKEYQLKDFPQFKIMRKGQMIFLINEYGKRTGLGSLGTTNLNGDSRPGFKDVKVCDLDHDRQPEFFIKMLEDKIGTEYYLVDSSGNDISERLFPGGVPVMQNPSFNYAKNELSFGYINLSKSPRIDYVNVFTYKNNRYINSKTILEGSCFSKNTGTKEEPPGSEAQGEFVSKQGKPVTLSGIAPMTANIFQNTDANLYHPHKTLAPGTTVRIIDMAVRALTVYVFIESAENGISGWSLISDFDNISCTEK